MTVAHNQTMCKQTTLSSTSNPVRYAVNFKLLFGSKNRFFSIYSYLLTFSQHIKCDTIKKFCGIQIIFCHI